MSYYQLIFFMRTIAKKMTATKATKTVAKKSAVKSSKKGKNSPVCVSGELRFWVNNGPVLSSLWDLERALSDISDDQYFYHANEWKNDFVPWVQYVLMDDVAAKALSGAKSRKEAKKKVSEVVKKYSK